MFASKVTSKGQVTIPLEIRKLLGISSGDKVAFSEAEDGSVIVRKLDEKKSLAGCLANKISKPATDEAIESAIQSG